MLGTEHFLQLQVLNFELVDLLHDMVEQGVHHGVGREPIRVLRLRDGVGAVLVLGVVVPWKRVFLVLLASPNQVLVGDASVALLAGLTEVFVHHLQPALEVEFRS